MKAIHNTVHVCSKLALPIMMNPWGFIFHKV